METKLVVFQNKEIRRTLHNGEWCFSVVDVCGVLTDSLDAGAYWRKLKQRLKAEGSEVVTFCHGLKLVAPDGKLRKQDAQGFTENKVAAYKGGQIAGEAREKLEVETGTPVVSSENYLTEPESKKRLTRKKL
jgi:hypothetical protein